VSEVSKRKCCEIGTVHTERIRANLLAEPILAAEVEIKSVSGTFCHGCSAGRRGVSERKQCEIGTAHTKRTGARDLARKR